MKFKKALSNINKNSEKKTDDMKDYEKSVRTGKPYFVKVKNIRSKIN